MSSDGADYLSSLLSGVTPETVALRMAQAFLQREHRVTIDASQLAIIREDDDAYYVGTTTAANDGRVQVRVTKDGATVERA